MAKLRERLRATARNRRCRGSTRNQALWETMVKFYGGNWNLGFELNWMSFAWRNFILKKDFKD